MGYILVRSLPCLTSIVLYFYELSMYNIYTHLKTILTIIHIVALVVLLR